MGIADAARPKRRGRIASAIYYDPVAEAVVCGAGAAGLAAAATLSRTGVGAIVLERSDGVGASWRARYDGLRLNKPAWMSTMPGYRASHRRYGEYPARDDWVRYLQDYVDHHRIDLRAADLATLDALWDEVKSLE